VDDAGITEALHRAAELIAQADALVVCAGAGMGVDSGLPDFRGSRGFWNAYPALGAAGITFHEIASPAAFDSDPRLAWGFYGHRLDLYRRTVPHAGFALLRRWGEALPQGVGVFTSNVDGQFQRAGFDAVAQCHGSIHQLQCSVPCSDAIWDAAGFVPEVDAAACRLLNDLPRCPRCGALARPNVLMFGDDRWCENRSMRQVARLDAWLGVLRRPLAIELGAGSAIASVRNFAARVVHERGGVLVRINPREAEVSRPQDVALPLGALEALSGMAALLA
jgi:NAD-dependent SIR2 family protein deacetylase